MGKKNGFSPPFHPYQLLSWLIQLWHLLLPLFFAESNLSSPLMLSFYLLYYLLSLLLILLAFLVTHSNPGIPLIKDPTYLNTEEPTNYYCTVCKTYVCKTTKHCGHCNRCIHGFDHHCKWLNNCIGFSNYKAFILLLIVLLVNEAVLIAFEGVFIRILHNFRGVVLIVDLVGNCWLVIVVGYLLGFHLYLARKGITTYEFLKGRKMAVTTDVEMDGNQVREVREADEKKKRRSRSEEPGRVSEDRKEYKEMMRHSLSKEEMVEKSVGFTESDNFKGRVFGDYIIV